LFVENKGHPRGGRRAALTRADASHPPNPAIAAQPVKQGDDPRSLLEKSVVIEQQNELAAAAAAKAATELATDPFTPATRRF